MLPCNLKGLFVFIKLTDTCVGTCIKSWWSANMSIRCKTKFWKCNCEEYFIWGGRSRAGERSHSQWRCCLTFTIVNILILVFEGMRLMKVKRRENCWIFSNPHKECEVYKHLTIKGKQYQITQSASYTCDFLQTIPSHRCNYKKQSISDVASDSTDRRADKKSLQNYITQFNFQLRMQMLLHAQPCVERHKDQNGKINTRESVKVSLWRY